MAFLFDGLCRIDGFGQRAFIHLCYFKCAQFPDGVSIAVRYLLRAVDLQVGRFGRLKGDDAIL